MSEDKIRAKKLDIIDDELQGLLPKTSKIIIGRDAYQIEELVEEQYDSIMDIVAEALYGIYSIKDNTAAEIDDTIAFSEMVRVISKHLPRIIETITGIPANEVKKNISARQAVHAARMVWETNFTNLLEEVVSLQRVVIDNYDMFMKDNIKEVDADVGED